MKGGEFLDYLSILRIRPAFSRMAVLQLFSFLPVAPERSNMALFGAVEKTDEYTILW
jgi:hypothetical protein